MRSEQPEIAGAADRIDRCFGDVFAVVLGSLLAADIEGKKLVKLGVGEAERRQVHGLGEELLQLTGQERLVPRAEFGQFIIRQTVGPPLLLGQVIEHDHRRLGQPEFRRSEDAAMAGDQFPVLCHEARHRPAVLRHRGGDLRHLVGAVRSSRSGHRASDARAAIARCAPERSSGSWVGTLGGGRVDFPEVDSDAGFHWAAVNSFRVQRNPPPEGGKCLKCGEN